VLAPRVSTVGVPSLNRRIPKPPIMPPVPRASALVWKPMKYVVGPSAPIIDGANLDVARKNAENTNSIMDSNKDILKKSQEILQALSGSRDGSLGIGQMGLGGNMSIAQAPSFGSILNGGALSFGGLSPEIQKIAGAVINGLQLVKHQIL